MSFVLGVDLGTSSVKSLILDAETGNTWVGQIEYQYDIPNIGWAEQNVEVWWKATKQSIKLALEKFPNSAKDISAISFSGQMHGIVALDSNRKVLCPAIIWCDQRSVEIVDRYSSPSNLDFFAENTANRLFTGFGLSSILWLKENKPEIYNNISSICCPKDYIRYRMTGVLATEQTDASSTLAFDVQKSVWSDEVCKKFSLDRSIFLETHLPHDFAGDILPKFAEEMGLSTTCKIYFGGSDQVMQAIGNGIINPGPVSVTIGTGGQVLTVLEKPLYHDSLSAHTFNFAHKNSWYFMGATLSAGQSLKWLKNNILHAHSYKKLDELAIEKPCGSEGLLFLPYLIGDRTPHSDARATGMFFGMNMKHDAGSMVRSVLEGVVYSLKESLDMLKDFGKLAEFVIASGGGANSPLWLQIQADIFNVPIYKSEMKEQAALGAAITAAVGCGIFDDYTSAINQIVVYSKEPILPNKDNVDIYLNNYMVYKKLYDSNRNNMHELININS